MPHFILKASPGVDQYVLWSTITEVPYFVGTRDECKSELDRANEASADQRFDRADAMGTSSIDGLDGWAVGKIDGQVIVEQKGFVKHSDLPEVYRLMSAGESYDHLVRYAHVNERVK